MSHLFSRFLSKLVWTLAASVLAGGLVIWLAGNGLDLREFVASLLRAGQAPENLPFAIAAGTMAVAIAGVCLFSMLRIFNRPPLTTTLQLRSALVSVHEHALDVFPNPENADAALRRLSLMLHDLEPYSSIGNEVRDLLDLSQTYLFELLPGGDEVRATAMHEKASEILESLMGSTDWASRSQGKQIANM